METLTSNGKELKANHKQEKHKQYEKHTKTPENYI